jgi:proline iminopeptidase
MIQLMKTVSLLIVSSLFFCLVKGQEVCSFKTSDGETLFYTKTGNGPVIVILSGGPGYGASGLQPWADTLSNKFKCILFEQRGIGLSETVRVDSTTINLRRAVQDIEDLRKHLDQEKISLCGISWGGGLAQAYSSFYPNNVKMMVLISSMGPDLTFLPAMNDNKTMRLYPSERDSIIVWNKQPSNRDLDFKKLAYSQLPYFFDHTKGLSIIQTAFTGLAFSLKVSELMWKDLNRTYDLKSRLVNYRGICIIFKPRQDVIPEEVAYKIKELIPHAKIITIERSGHYPHLENPESFYPLFKSAFLDYR